MTLNLKQSYATVARQEWYGSLVAVILLAIVLSFASEYFLTTGNLSNIMVQASVVALLAGGQTFVILTAGVDLAVGALTALAGAVAGYMMVKLVWSNETKLTLSTIEEMLREIGGVPGRITSDNPKCFALEASRYEPLLNPALERMAGHYGMRIECLPPADPENQRSGRWGGHCRIWIPTCRQRSASAATSTRSSLPETCTCSRHCPMTSTGCSGCAGNTTGSRCSWSPPQLPGCGGPATPSAS